MGEIRAKCQLAKVGGKKKAIEIDALVDTGAVMTLLPEDLVDGLELERDGKVVVSLANDQKIELSVALPLLLKIGNRSMVTDCLVGPPQCEPLIGQLVLERLDLIVDPLKKTLSPRPESPYIPSLKMK